jgi:hypothetical protein
MKKLTFLEWEHHKKRSYSQIIAARKNENVRPACTVMHSSPQKNSAAYILPANKHDEFISQINLA